jgi:hypothetical protein
MEPPSLYVGAPYVCYYGNGYGNRHVVWRRTDFVKTFISMSVLCFPYLKVVDQSIISSNDVTNINVYFTCNFSLHLPENRVYFYYKVQSINPLK